MCIFIFLTPKFTFITLGSVTQFKGALYLWRVQIQISFGSEYFANSLPFKPQEFHIKQSWVGKSAHYWHDWIKANRLRPALTPKLKCQFCHHKNVSSPVSLWINIHRIALNTLFLKILKKRGLGFAKSGRILGRKTYHVLWTKYSDCLFFNSVICLFISANLADAEETLTVGPGLHENSRGWTHEHMCLLKTQDFVLHSPCVISLWHPFIVVQNLMMLGLFKP